MSSAAAQGQAPRIFTVDFVGASVLALTNLASTLAPTLKPKPQNGLRHPAKAKLASRYQIQGNGLVPDAHRPDT